MCETGNPGGLVFGGGDVRVGWLVGCSGGGATRSMREKEKEKEKEKTKGFSGFDGCRSGEVDGLADEVATKPPSP